MKLLTLADGFGDSAAYPLWYDGYYKWPELIQLMTKDVQLTNLSRYGAGNEFMVNALRKNYNQQDYVIVQWAMPDRLDLLLAHAEYQDFWNNIIQQDKTYSKNVVDGYWISSNTQNTDVREYHKKYISLEQHRSRTQLFIDYAELLLQSKGIDFKFMLTCDSQYLDQPGRNIDNWLWHSPWLGMDSFRTRSQYSDLDFGYRQPIPLIQFDYIQQYIIPNTTLPWRGSQELKAVESMLHRKYKQAIINKPNDTHKKPNC